MSLFAAVLICFIPLIIGVALCLYFIKDFKVLYALIAILLGFVAIFVILLFRAAVEELGNIFPITIAGFAGFLITTLLFAFLEEVAKMLLLPFFSKKIKTLQIFLLTSLIFGCSVGCYETLMYLVTGYDGTVMRLFTAVLIHTACAGLSSYFIWALKTKEHFIRAFAVSVLLHGLYNFFVIQGTYLGWLAIVTILLSFIKMRSYYVLFLEREKNII